MPLSIQDLMDKMPDAFLPEKAEGVDVVIQFNFEGDDGGDWYVTIKDGICTTAKGLHESPTMTLGAETTDYVDLVTGKLDGMQAFMQGKLKLQGDINLAMKMTNYFDLSE